jgi:hypothetical protein
MVTVCTFNVNNVFVRYRFRDSFQGAPANSPQPGAPIGTAQRRAAINMLIEEPGAAPTVSASPATAGSACCSSPPDHVAYGECPNMLRSEACTATTRRSASTDADPRGRFHDVNRGCGCPVVDSKRVEASGWRRWAPCVIRPLGQSMPTT